MVRSTHHLGLIATATALTLGCGTTAAEEVEAIVCDGDACDIQANILTDTTLDATKVYTLRAGIFVGDGESNDATLTIPAGTVIKGDTSSLTFLAIQRNSKIEANGTAAAPIVFTSAKAEGTRAPGDWGGLIINGNAPTNKCPDLSACAAEGEGGGGTYGGADTADSSGTLRFVRVEFGGKQITDENELNGVAFQGVGSGTVVEDLHVHRSKDDGVEFFGGNVNVKRVLLTCIGDDNIDWTNGWRGKGQFLAAVQCDGDGDQGIEADSNGSTPTATPVSNPTLSNVTLVGPASGSSSDYGVLLRAATAGSLSNVIVTGFQETCVGVDEEPTFSRIGAADDALTMTHSIIDCAEGSVPFCDATKLGDGDDCTSDGMDHSRVEDFFTGASTNQQVDPQLGDAFPADLADLDLAPAAGSPALGAGAAPSDPFFEPVDYIGAFAAGENWADWTAFPEN